MLCTDTALPVTLGMGFPNPFHGLRPGCPLVLLCWEEADLYVVPGALTEQLGTLGAGMEFAALCHLPPCAGLVLSSQCMGKG